MDRDAARSLMHQWTQSPALRVHMECVAACMAAYARLLDPAHEDRWFVAGLLHDFDYERNPSPDQHPRVAADHLRALGMDDEIITAILSHAPHTGVPRSSPMGRALFAVDELAGFIVACAKVRPAGVMDLEPRSVRKKLKDRSFAAAVSRGDIALGIAELGVEESEHVERCIAAIRAQAARLGLGGGT